MTNGTVVIQGKANVEKASILAVRSALKLEVKVPALKHSRVDMAKRAREILGSTTRDKAKLLEELNAYIEANILPKE